MAESSDILARNLAALGRVDPALAERLRGLTPAPLAWAPSKAGPLTASVEHGGRALMLASRYDPEAEAARLVDAVDFDKSACAVLLGVGLGYHARIAARGLGTTGLLVAYEPDEALLRATLERIDHSGWLQNAILFAGEADRAAMIARFERHAGLLTQGTQLVTHPPTRQRQPEALKAFGEALADVLAYCRTNVATALVNSTRTCFNSASNLAHYAAGATTDELIDAARGYPAVCVGAGPSLVKNVDLLRDPAVRRNVVVVAAQTTLKPLLDRGIRPDFVTALDYAAISARFYEDLPDLPDVTLVVEPKVHPTVLDHFPGPIRVAKSDFNDQLLGDLARERVAIPSGATVAHLSLYLAAHLGCDPIVMIGQDLGFSDGLYYAPGTAIHRVWSAELNAFNTLEMMEWQRIVRHKTHLKRLEDVHGRPIFSDEQMLTYLKQFERDFKAAAAAGRTIIDATEGGLPKRDTRRMTLAEALAAHATRPVPDLPRAPREPDPDRLGAVAELMTRRVREVTALARATREAADILRQMREHQHDRRRMAELFAKIERHQRRVEGELKPAFTLVNTLNTIGMFKRSRSDRAIARHDGDAYERQRRQIDRDLENMHWLAQACDETLAIFEEARGRIAAARQKEAAPTAA